MQENQQKERDLKVKFPGQFDDNICDYRLAYTSLISLLESNKNRIQTSISEYEKRIVSLQKELSNLETTIKTVHESVLQSEQFSYISSISPYNFITNYDSKSAMLFSAVARNTLAFTAESRNIAGLNVDDVKKLSEIRCHVKETNPMIFGVNQDVKEKFYTFHKMTKKNTDESIAPSIRHYDGFNSIDAFDPTNGTKSTASVTIPLDKVVQQALQDSGVCPEDVVVAENNYRIKGNEEYVIPPLEKPLTEVVNEAITKTAEADYSGTCMVKDYHGYLDVRVNVSNETTITDEGDGSVQLDLFETK